MAAAAPWEDEDDPEPEPDEPAAAPEADEAMLPVALETEARIDEIWLDAEAVIPEIEDEAVSEAPPDVELAPLAPPAPPSVPEALLVTVLVSVIVVVPAPPAPPAGVPVVVAITDPPAPVPTDTPAEAQAAMPYATTEDWTEAPQASPEQSRRPAAKLGLPHRQPTSAEEHPRLWKRLNILVTHI